jgi:hypothetical protein
MLYDIFPFSHLQCLTGLVERVYICWLLFGMVSHTVFATGHFVWVGHLARQIICHLAPGQNICLWAK